LLASRARDDDRDGTLARGRMPIAVDAYTLGGVASGVSPRAGHLREVLELEGRLVLEQVQWRPLDGSAPQALREVAIPIDDILIAVSGEDDTLPVHAQWHAIRVELGPYVVEGEMPTMPGFDPGRALTRPTGEFVQLRDVRLGERLAGVAAPAERRIGDHALINRYVVESVAADLMLGFFFPGAEMVSTEPDVQEIPTQSKPTASSADATVSAAEATAGSGEATA
jgi:hypothetical protein